MSKADQYFDFILEHIEDEGRPPSIQEMASRFSDSKTTAAYYRERLAWLGKIEIKEGKHCGIKVVSHA